MLAKFSQLHHLGIRRVPPLSPSPLHVGGKKYKKNVIKKKKVPIIWTLLANWSCWFSQVPLLLYHVILVVNWVQTLRAIEVGKGPRLFVRSPIQPEKVKGIHSFIIFGWSITCNTSFFGDFKYRKGDSHNLHNPILDVFFVVPSKLRSPSISVVRGVWLGENHSEMYHFSPTENHRKHPQTKHSGSSDWTHILVLLFEKGHLLQVEAAVCRDKAWIF